MGWQDEAIPLDPEKKSPPDERPAWMKEAQPLSGVPVQPKGDWRDEAMEVQDMDESMPVRIARTIASVPLGAARIGAGIVEQPAAGIGALGEMAVHGASALGKTLLPRIPFIDKVAEAVANEALDSNFEQRIMHSSSPRAIEEAMAQRERARANLEDSITGLRIARSMPIADQFMEEYELSGKETTGFKGGVNWLFGQMKPQTETGRYIFDTIGHWLERGLDAVGTKAMDEGLISAAPAPFGPIGSIIREEVTSPEMKAAEGAVFKGLAAVAGLGLGARRAIRPQEGIKTPEQWRGELQKDPQAFMEEHFPQAWHQIENAQHGKVKVGMPGGVEANVMGQIRNTLDTLGVPEELYNNRSLQEMVIMTLDTVDKRGEISPNMRSAIADATVDQVNLLKSIEDAMTPKALPAPSPIPGIIQVDSSGRAATPAQRVSGSAVFEALSNEQRAEILGIGPMGILRTRTDAYRRALREAGVTEAAGEVQPAVAAARKSVEDAWAQSFPLGKSHPGISKEQRAQVLQEWLAQGAPFEEWGVLASRVYNRPVRFKGGKQAGIISMEPLEGLPKKDRQVLGRALNAPRRPPDGDEMGFRRIEAAWEQLERERSAREKVTLGKLAAAFRDKVADHQGTLKRHLEQAGPLGVEVKDRLTVFGAATMRGKFMYERTAKPIFQGLSARDVQDLNKMVSARNMVEAKRRNDKYRGRDGLTPEDMEGWVRSFAKNDPKRFQKVEAAADKVFQVYRSQLDELVEAGLLSRENYGRAVRADSVSDIARILDPELEGVPSLTPGSPATASGIPYMKLGKKTPALMSARQLLSETIGRAQNQIMRNDAAKALYKLAEANPNLGFVTTYPVSKHGKTGKAEGVYVPPGYMKISAWEGGKEKVLLIDEPLGQQWYHRPPAMDSILADIGRLVSGSALVRTLATSYNPLFPVAGIPMDVVHLFTAGKGYSTNPGIFLGQLGVDLATIAYDAISRGPRFQQAMKEGMGFDFMTHQGRDFFIHTSSLEKQFNPHMERLKKALSWLNETAEIEIRLAHRERLIKNGLPSWQATAQARERLDYSQGGVISKGADVWIPYANVAVQAWRSALKENAEHPGKAASRLAWATASIMGLTWISMMQDLEAWLDISPRDKINGIPLIIPNLVLIDSAGNRRVGYVNIRSDNTLAPLHALTTAVMQKAVTGDAPEGMVWDTMQSLPSMLQFGTWPVPSVEAAYRYATNKDIRSDSPIWTGAKVPPELEFKGAAYQQPTSWLARGIGDLTGASPARLEAASRALLPSNPYVGAIQGLVNMALDTQSPSVRTKSTMEMLAQNQALRRVIKFTHPANRELEAIDKAEREKGGRVKLLTDTVDEYVVKYNQQDITEKDFEAWVKTQPEDLQERLSKRFRTGVAFEHVMKVTHASEEIPSRAWWMGLAHQDAEVRADVFFDRWISASGEERKRMEAVAGGLTEFGIGFRSDDFNRYFARRLQQYSQDQR